MAAKRLLFDGSHFKADTWGPLIFIHRRIHAKDTFCPTPPCYTAGMKSKSADDKGFDIIDTDLFQMGIDEEWAA